MYEIYLQISIIKCVLNFYQIYNIYIYIYNDCIFENIKIFINKINIILFEMNKKII